MLMPMWLRRIASAVMAEVDYSDAAVTARNMYAQLIGAAVVH